MTRLSDCPAVILAAFLLAFQLPPDARAGEFQDGDVFVSVGGGRVARLSANGRSRELFRSHASGEAGSLCFDVRGNLYVANFEAQTMSLFNSAGRLIDRDWGGPFTGYPESCIVDSAGFIYTSEVDGRDLLRKFDSKGKLVDSFRLASGARGVDWIDLAADQCTVFYTSEDDRVKRYDVCRRRQLPDFASGLSVPCYALRVRENAEVLVTCAQSVYRLDRNGSVMKTYSFREDLVFSMNLDPDGQHFWVAPPKGGNVYKVHIETGNGTVRPVFNAFQEIGTGFLERLMGSVNVGGLAIFGERTAAIAEELSKRADRDRDAKRKAEIEAKRKAEEEEARRRAEVEAKRKAEEEEARRRAEEEARRRAEEEARRRAEEEARRRAEEEAARRRGKVTFGPASPLDFGELAANDVASESLDLTGTRLEGTATARITSSLKASGLVLEIETDDGWESLGSRPLELPLEETGRRTWPMRVRIGRCAPGVPAADEHEIVVEAPGLDQPTVTLRAPLDVTVTASSGLYCWWPLLASAAGALLATVLVGGFIVPARFAPRLGVVLSPEEDMNEGFFHPIRRQRGSGAGFYRDARIYVSSDFRLRGQSKGALAQLRARRHGAYVKPVHGALVWRRNLDGEWEELPVHESRARPGTVYRDDLGSLFFEIRNG